MKAISTLSIIPVRKEPSDRSEMVSQILFGESFEVIESKNNWSFVQLSFDDYTGWVDSKQITFLKDEDELSNSSKSVLTDLTGTVLQGNKRFRIVIGSSFPPLKGKSFFINQQEYTLEGNTTDLNDRDPSQMIDHAMKYLNSPYLWGGRSPFGIDCSGFTQLVFKLCGMNLKRDAYQQAEQGAPVISIDEAKERDLAFFKNEEGRIVHTGIILSKNRIIHASGQVHIDTLDGKGILNENSNRHTHQLALIRRFC